MAGIGDVAHITNLIAEMPEVPVNNVKGDEGSGMAEMALSTYSWTTHIQPYFSGYKRLKNFLLA
jgi:hypothetical protein